MPVTLNITADSAVELVQEFRRLNAETSPSSETFSITDMPLDALIHVVRERLRDDGYKLEIIDQRDSNPPTSPPQTAPEAGPQIDPPSPEPEPKAKRARKANGPVPETIATPTTTTTTTEPDEIFAPRKSPKGQVKASLVDLDETKAEPDPEGDRQHVLDTLAGILKDPERKDRVLKFASSMAKQHGKDKISELPAAPFPEIRQAMEKEFPDDRSAA